MRRSLAPRALAALMASLALFGAPAVAQTQGEDLQGFCNARLALEEALQHGGDDVISETTGALVDSAPAPVADAARTLAALLVSDDPDAFESEEAVQARETIDSYVLANCGFRTVAVSGVDYEFRGVPKVVEAGIVAFQLSNDAEEEEHELVVIRVKRGVKTPAKKLLGLPEDKLASKVEVIGHAHAEAAGSEATFIELEPGRYLVACFLPVGGKEDGKPHWKRGMYAQFRVAVT